VPDSFTHALPAGLYAAYDFANAHDSRVLDQYGVTDGFTQGNPAWYSGDGQRSGFLAFNGADQFVQLDRSLSDVREITIAAWVKWSGGAGNQPVWYFGTAANRCMYLTPDDGTGQATVSIANGSAAQTLAANSA
jgi:arabinan endo-1,5-alpha-L-arabinosidase